LDPADTQPSRLEKIVRHGEGWTAVGLRGTIDEHAGLAVVSGQVRGPLVVVDLAAIARINSVGVRDWMIWLKSLAEAGRRVVLVDCSPAMMDQVNLVRNFAQGAWIDSFLAPYFCDRCDLERDERLDPVALRRDGASEAPTITCGKPACGLRFDDVEEGYFAFLDDREPPADLDAVRAQVAQARQALNAGQGQNPVLESGATAPARPPTPPPRAVVAPPPTPPAPAASAPLNTSAQRHWATEFLFVTLLTLLGGLLGFLIYLMMTLE
jgi:anti-anti-sigma regulatory factor